ncbi:MAG: helix-turn-helix domain-containing protein [Vicinamibacterales bacterium]
MNRESDDSADNGRERLESWKEIAAYLRASVRTVQRWEKESGLPVHGRQRLRGRTVFAFRHELDEWQRGFVAPGTPSNGLARESEDSGSVHVERQEPARESTDSIDMARERLPASAADSPTDSPSSVGRNRRKWGWAALAGVIVLSAVSALLYRNRHGEVMYADWDMRSRVLTARDPAGRAVWATSPFHEMLMEEWYSDYNRRRYGPAAVAADIDADGHKEVLFLLKTMSPLGSVVLCYNSDGTLRFRHRSARSVTCGSELHGGDLFSVNQLAVGSSGSEKPIWVVSSHREFPTHVERLAPDGQVQSDVWLNGHATVVAEIERAGRRYLLVGGTSNDPESLGSAALTMIDPAQPRAAVPALAEEYRCGDEGLPAPFRYVKFPRLDLARIAGARVYVQQIFTRPDGRIDVVVSQGLEYLTGRPNWSESGVQYTLDADLNVLSAGFEDNFVTVHAAFERSGALSHKLGTPEQEGAWDILAWHEGRPVPVRRPPDGGRR